MATTYQGLSDATWARSAVTTLQKHFRDIEEAMLRKLPFLALLEQQGRVMFNEAGRGFDWPVQYRLHDVAGNSGEAPRNFARRNLWKRPELPWRGYIVTDAITEAEYLENRGEEAIVPVFGKMVQRLETSMRQQLSKEWVVDGNATGNDLRWHGIESFMALNGTVTITSGAQRSANAADWVGYPADTYAAHTTGLADYGGEQRSGDYWPTGTADPQYDWFSPIVVNYASTAFGGTTAEWADQGEEAMRFGMIHTGRNDAEYPGTTQIFLDRSLYFQYMQKTSAKERIMVQGAADSGLRSLGFGNVIMLDGVEVTFDNAVPANVGYGINPQNIELLNQYDSLFRTEGPVWDIDDSAYKSVVANRSNLKFASPRCFFKLQDIA